MAINLARLQPTQVAATSGRRVRVPVRPGIEESLGYSKEMEALEAKKAADLAAMEAETAAAKAKIQEGQVLALSELDALAPKQSASTAAVAPMAAPQVNLADVSAKKDPRTTSAYEAPQDLSGTQEFKMPDPSRETSGEDSPQTPTGPPMSMTATGVVTGQEVAEQIGKTIGSIALPQVFSLPSTIMGWIEMTQRAQKAMDLHKGTISSMSDPGAKGKRASHEATAGFDAPSQGHAEASASTGPMGLAGEAPDSVGQGFGAASGGGGGK